MNLVALQFKTDEINYQNNLDKLLDLISNAQVDDFVLAPELCLTGYSYDDLKDATDFSTKAIKILKEVSKDKKIALTLIQYNNTTKRYTNTLHIFHNSKIVYTQDKTMLFTLNHEEKYFQAGDINNFKIIEIDGIKIASLICFELRFNSLWEIIKGADIIIIPSMWGISRKQNFETLTNALAIINQCYVIASNSSNENMASSSGIINPFGLELRDDNKEFLSIQFDKREIKKMRRYLNVGIS